MKYDIKNKCWRSANSTFEKGARGIDNNIRWFIFKLQFIFIGLVFLLQGCIPELLTEEALQAYVREPDHGLLQTAKRGSLEVSAAYRPTDLVVAQELRNQARTEEEIKELRAKYGNYDYFVLSIANDGKDALYSTAGSYQAFSDNLQKLSFRMPEYLHMTTSDRDTVYLADYHFSRLHGMGGSTQVLLAFERNKIQEKDWVQLNLKEMGFGAGRVNLRFDMQDILNTPKIDFLNQENTK